MRRLSLIARNSRTFRKHRTVVETIIEGPRVRLPPPAALAFLVVGLGLALIVDRALAHESDAVVSDAASERPRRMITSVTAGAPEIVDVAPVGAPTLGAASIADGNRLVATYGDTLAVLTRDPALEAKLNQMLEDGQTPFGATVLIEIGTGRVLAVAEHSTRGDASGLAMAPVAPAASVFKLVTTSALLRAGVSSSTKVCIHGGKTRMQASLLVDDPKRDRTCTTLGDALALSQNVAIAKLALRHLDPERLRDEAHAFLFAESLPSDIALTVLPSPAGIPDDPFGFANAAAGFGDVKLSPMHAAVLAATFAQHGVLIPPRFVDSVTSGDAPKPAASKRVMDEDDADRIAAMMADTVERGTARRSFAAAPRLKKSAAGKTGSLTDYSTGLETTWFVGFAPVDNPQVAVATVVVNTAKWHVRAPVVAKEALREYFAAHKEKRTVVASR